MPSIGDDRRWVIEQWQRLFGKPPDRESLDQQVARLRNGESRQAWVQRVEQGHAKAVVQQAYQEAGLRPGDNRDRLYRQVRTGRLSADDLRQRIADSPRALLRDGTTPPTRRRDSDAYLNLRNTLKAWGLGELADWAWNQLQANRPPERIISELRETKPYRQRFKGMALREQAGLPAISEAEYLALERGMRNTLHRAGLPEHFYDSPDDYAELIGQDVSVDELGSRVTEGYRRVMNADPTVRAELNRLYGIGPGELAAWFLDPDRGEHVIQAKVTGAFIGAAARDTGFGQLTRAQVQGLAEDGVDPGAAQEGFSTLAAQSELFTALPGEPGGQIETDTQIAALFGGNAKAQERIRKRAESRVTQGSGSAGFGLAGGGVLGLAGDR